MLHVQEIKIKCFDKYIRFSDNEINLKFKPKFGLRALKYV